MLFYSIVTLSVFVSTLETEIMEGNQIFSFPERPLPFNEASKFCADQAMIVEKNWDTSCGISNKANHIWLGQVDVNESNNTMLKWTDGSWPVTVTSSLPSACAINPCCATVFCQTKQIQISPCNNQIMFVCSLRVPKYQKRLNETLNQLIYKQGKMNEEINEMKSFMERDQNKTQTLIKGISQQLAIKWNTTEQVIENLGLGLIQLQIISEARQDGDRNDTTNIVRENRNMSLTTVALGISVVSIVLITINWFFLRRQIHPKRLERRIEKMNSKRRKKMEEDQVKESQEYNGPFQMIELPPDSDDDDDLPLPPPPDEMLAITSC